MTNYRYNDTIVAIATPRGRGALSVVRLSGSESLSIGKRIFKGKGNLETAPGNSAHLGKIYYRDHLLDQVIVTVFRTPHSYTGEDMLEFSVHGGSFISGKLLEILCGEGARLAEPGEFTLRRFLNGKIDLLQAEAVNVIVEAPNQNALENAISHLEGELSQKISSIEQNLQNIQTELTASLDFPEEELNLKPENELKTELDKVCSILQKLVQSYETGRILSEGFSIVITGKPNVGKSSLFNRLLREDRVIVSPTPGTTRDIVDAHLIVNNLPIHLFDTAGIRRVQDSLELEGVQRSRNKFNQADLIILVLDLSQPLTDEDLRLYKEVNRYPVIVLLNKSDLGICRTTKELVTKWNVDHCQSSLIKDWDIEELHDLIGKHLEYGDIENSVILTSIRQKVLLQEALCSLNKACEMLTESTMDIAHFEIEAALVKIQHLQGKIIDPEILDNIFSKFCIGK
ncbi:tRNA uridine-5-carboxymethylaminomethyl(34) synthesis GTPase MnmE [bacterium]|nr:tRNA uridine-5-carboxymethylaminomethyl(34) synthesis GTPase MnmE [bacterium]